MFVAIVASLSSSHRAGYDGCAANQCAGMSKARMQTAAYAALGLALALWLAGDLVWILSGEARGPFPGDADWLWLAGYPAACAGLALLLRARLRSALGPTMWLDGAIAAAAVASLIAAASP